MGTNTMSFALPDAMRSNVDQRVRSGPHGITGEYLRKLSGATRKNWPTSACAS